MKTSYTKHHKKYYETHKKQIIAYHMLWLKKNRKRWNEYQRFRRKLLDSKFTEKEFSNTP